MTGILFRCPKALNFLLEHGEVYTIRLHPKVEGTYYLHAHKMHNRIGRVTVKRVGRVWRFGNDIVVFPDGENTIAYLDRYVNKSGFSSVKEWVQEVEYMNKRRFRKGYLYHVKLIELFDEVSENVSGK